MPLSFQEPHMHWLFVAKTQDKEKHSRIHTEEGKLIIPNIMLTFNELSQTTTTTTHSVLHWHWAGLTSVRVEVECSSSVAWLDAIGHSAILPLVGISGHDIERHKAHRLVLHDTDSCWRAEHWRIVVLISYVDSRRDRSPATLAGIVGRVCCLYNQY